MANPWFKLYGTEMLSDPKYQRLNAGERSCWVTLLCLGSIDNGVIRHCEEQYLISHSGIDVMDIGKYHGILLKFEMLGMITKGRDEKGGEYIQIKNWQKRQEVYSESRDRVRRWREKHGVTERALHGNGSPVTRALHGGADFVKPSSNINTNRVTPVTLRGNARIDKNRIDKNRIENTGTNVPSLKTEIRESGDIGTLIEKKKSKWGVV